MTFGWKQYWKPTPKLVRKVADAVISITTLAGSIITIDKNPVTGTIIMALGVVAKVVSNFFGEEESKQPINPSL